MYNPTRYRSEDLSEAFNVMDRFPFATLISVDAEGVHISHVPLTPIRVPGGDSISLIGHLAKANPHSKVLLNSKSTAIFKGPHTYITPNWYAENDVPTWNYSAVHATGDLELYTDYEEILECLRVLTSHVEKHWPSGWEFFVPPDLGQGILEKSIVGFKMKIEAIEFKKKLSQNRTPADRAGILKGLESRADENSGLVLEDMRLLYRADGEKRT